jgi:hypothetical protein
MIITLIALVLGFITPSANAQSVTVIPPMPLYSPTVAITDDDAEWELYSQDAYYDYCAEFTAIFDAVQVKRAKNGRVMVRSANGGSFKFAKGVK